MPFRYLIVCGIVISLVLFAGLHMFWKFDWDGSGDKCAKIVLLVTVSNKLSVKVATYKLSSEKALQDLK